jgi:HD-GYP domain-containing protein (c-di-GMP phosphodiesterase class II)
MRLHPDYGYKLMVDRVGGTPHEWVVVHQHHETLDGGGYPKGKRDREIHEFSRVVAVADMYDALRSDRPYKKGWSAHKVMTFLNSEEMRDKLDSTALATLNRIVICFPVGSTVKLNDGRLAKVVSNRDDDPLQPTVATLPDPETGQGGGETLDLASDPRLAITDLLE